jgi:hypothetical protein
MGDNVPAAEARLADQVFRLSASLCVDGCRACLHRTSALMTDAQTASAVSRDLLQRYREFALEPLTLRVGSSPPQHAEVQRILAEQGTCRLLIEPARYDALRPRLEQLHFGEGAFDPCLRVIVCVWAGS